MCASRAAFASARPKPLALRSNLIASIRRPAFRASWTSGGSGAVRAAAVVAMALGAWWLYATGDEQRAAEPEPQQARATPPQLVTSFAGVRLGGKLADAPKALGPFDKHKDEPHAVKMYPDEEDHWQRNGRLRLGGRRGVVFSLGCPFARGRGSTSMNQFTSC